VCHVLLLLQVMALKSQDDDMQESAFTQLKTFYDDTRCVDRRSQLQPHHATAQALQPTLSAWSNLHLAIRQLGSKCLLTTESCTCGQGKNAARSTQHVGYMHAVLASSVGFSRSPSSTALSPRAQRGCFVLSSPFPAAAYSHNLPALAGSCPC
jgi:hypothetical protein